MVTQTLTIRNAENGELELELTDPTPSPDVVTFINGSDADCGVWFDNEASFGLHCFRLVMGGLRRLSYGGQKTKYALFKLPQPHRDLGPPDDIPVGN